MKRNQLFREIKAQVAFHLVHLELDAERASADAVEYLKSLINVYNKWQETDKAGADCIYNINEAEDLKRCIECGMTARQISILYQITENYQFPLFVFGENHPNPLPLLNWREVRVRLLNSLDEMVESVLTHD